MKRKGFTLVEMLAVVGVVAVLVILVLPNALKNYRDGKKTAFIDEAKTVYTKATDTYVTERTKGNRIGYISNTDDVGKSLNLSNEKNLQYNVMLDPKGKVTSFVLVNNEFCIVGSGDFLDKYSIDDIIDLTDLNGKEMDPELVAKCTFDTFAAGTELYVLLHTDNRTTAHNPTAITLKYGEGWYKGQSTRNTLTINDGFYVIDNIPTRKNYYYAGTKTADGVEVIDCSGKVRIDNNGNGIFNPSDKSNRKTDATANMIKKYYTIVFNYNEGSGNIGNVKCDYDTTCNVPTTVPTRTGYNFIGWKFGSKTYQPGEAMDVITDDNEDSNSSFKFSNSNICNGGDQTIQNDKTFMAQWEGRPYNIAYDCNGITCPTLPTSAKYDELVTIANPSRTGYTFTGWTITNHNATTAKMGTDPDVTKLNTSISGTPKNLYYKNLTDIENHTVNYKANWTVNKYTITYVLNGGTNPADAWTEYTVEDDYKLPIPTRTGYSFVGWYTASDFSGSPVTKIESPTTGNKTFYAKWTYGIYTITLKNNNATTAGTSKIYEKYTQGWYSDSSANTSIDKITSPKRNNYTFAGYYDGSAQIIDKSGNIKASNTKYSADKSLDTKWCNNCNANDHGTCTLSINATTGACSYTTSCSTGYTLGNNGKYNYTCTVNEYTITYYLNNGTNPSGVKNKYTVEDEYTLPTPTRTGYTFGGWYTSSDFSGTAVTKIAKGSTGNKKFYAKWNYGIFTITLNNKDATTNGTGAIYEQYTQSWHSSSSVSNSNKITSITKPQRTNYTFAGYYDSGAVVDKDGNIKAANNKYTADKTLAPTWCRSCATVSNGTCTLSINATTGACTYTTNCNNNYTLKSGSGTYDPKCCRNCASVSHGTCTLSYDSGCKYSTTCNTGYSVNNNGQYNATCTATSYTITYELNGGTNPSNAKTSYTIEDEYTLPTPTKTDNYFGGWYTSSDFSGTAVTKIAKGSTGNKKFYAKWTGKNVRIYYNKNGGTVSSTTYSLKGNWISKDGGSTYFYQSIAVGGKSDPYNLSTFGLTKSGVYATDWCTASDGTGTCFGQDTEYTHAQYKAAATDKDTYYELDLYPKWINKPVRAYFNKNGGSMNSTTYSLKGNWVSKDGGSTYFYQNITGSTDLYNVGTFGLSRTNYTADTWCTGSGGGGSCYNHDTTYTYAQFKAGATEKDTYYELDLYVKWVVACTQIEVCVCPESTHWYNDHCVAYGKDNPSLYDACERNKCGRSGVAYWCCLYSEAISCSYECE